MSNTIFSARVVYCRSAKSAQVDVTNLLAQPADTRVEHLFAEASDVMTYLVIAGFSSAQS